MYSNEIRCFGIRGDWDVLGAKFWQIRLFLCTTVYMQAGLHKNNAIPALDKIRYNPTSISDSVQRFEGLRTCNILLKSPKVWTVTKRIMEGLRNIDACEIAFWEMSETLRSPFYDCSLFCLTTWLQSLWGLDGGNYKHNRVQES